MTDEKPQAKWERILLVATILCSGVVSILDLLGLLDSLPWLSTRISTITLLMVGLVAGYLMIERRTKLEHIEELIQTNAARTQETLATNLEKTITALQGVEVVRFSSRESFLLHLRKRVQGATSTIDVTHLNLSHPTSQEERAYYEAMDKVIKRGKVKVRRVAVVHDRETLDWIEDTLKLQGEKFFVGCYSPSSHKVPMFNIMIIDGVEAYIGGGTRTPASRVTTLMIKHPDIIEMLQEHFETLWQNSSLVNDPTVNQDVLEALRHEVQSSEQKGGLTRVGSDAAHFRR